MGLTLAIDFGSTFTKAVAIDLEAEELVGVAQAKSTVGTDVTEGLEAAVSGLEKVLRAEKLVPERIVSCSSAAGGLKMAVAGLVRLLTTKAAQEACTGAGAKVVTTSSFGLSPEDVRQWERLKPDIILLTGGTDGGNREIVLQNAAMLAASALSAPIVVAGNKVVSRQAQELLEAAGKYTVVSENVLPELDVLNVEPTRAVIRDIFMERITRAKGLDRAQAYVGHIIIPTPLAVLYGASLLADGTPDEAGLGELVVVDVGGATTDVCSIAHGHPASEGVLVKGLPEPYVKRTVEGDLGIRFNAESILEIAGEKSILERIACLCELSPGELDLATVTKHLAAYTETVPQNDRDYFIDVGLAGTAVDIATRRHAGTTAEKYYPSGKIRVQTGKDLTGIRKVVGTGGVLAYGREPRRILQAACYSNESPESLRPMAPEFLVDDRYIMYAVGLLARDFPDKALRIMKKHLRKV